MESLERVLINEKLIEDVKYHITQKNRKILIRLIDSVRAPDMADLMEHLDHEERMYLMDLFEAGDAGEVLIEIETPVQESIIRYLDNEAISEIVQELESDDATDLLSTLPADRVEEIIDSVDDEVSKRLERLLPYPEDTAGGNMALEFVAVKEDSTIKDAIEIIREKRDSVKNIYYLFVVDDLNRLVGVVSLKDLVLGSPEQRINEIMNPEVISVNANRDQEKVYHLFKRYDLVAIPVVDDQNRLIGRITHDDILDVIEDEADEDISLMAGVIQQEITEDSPVKISRARLPWLIAGLFGGILAALVINRFESSLERMITLSFFFPVVMAMGGNAGTQSATIAVRGLATGDIRLVFIWKRLLVEMKVAFLNGIICGIILGLIVGFWLSDYGLGFVVTLSLVMIIINSGFIGAAMPFVFKRFGVDPALATGPFVTTSNDIMSLLIYLTFVTIYLHIA